MPRSIILCPPEGASGIKRRRYTAREKVAITAKILCIKRETNVSYPQAAASIAFDIRSWFVGMPSVRASTTSISRSYHAIQPIKGIVVNLRAWRKS